MPSVQRLMPEWVLTRRWCLKRRKSLKGRGRGGEWLDYHSRYIPWSESINHSTQAGFYLVVRRVFNLL